MTHHTVTADVLQEATLRILGRYKDQMVTAHTIGQIKQEFEALMRESCPRIYDLLCFDVVQGSVHGQIEARLVRRDGCDITYDWVRKNVPELMKGMSKDLGQGWNPFGGMS